MRMGDAVTVDGQSVDGQSFVFFKLRMPQNFFACYLLTTLDPAHSGGTYIGFTVKPSRRIRQHNGEIKAGAWRTKKWRPWEMLMFIHGFPSKVRYHQQKMLQ
jgi:predicted GIY-YIG superfamily endonuclease